MSRFNCVMGILLCLKLRPSLTVRFGKLLSQMLLDLVHSDVCLNKNTIAGNISHTNTGRTSSLNY